MFRGILILMMFGVGSFSLYAQNLTIHAINVDQGDAILIQADTYAMLINAGYTNAARDTILQLLNRLNIDTLDYVLTTHYDNDHIGNIDRLMPYVHYSNVIDRGDWMPPASQIYTRYRNAVSTIRDSIQWNDTIPFGDAQIQCVAVKCVLRIE